MNKIPADPLAFIQKCIRKKKLFWTWHANMRMAKRFIPREAILEGVDSYEILEEYPDDKYMPSYLVYARHRGIVFHVLFAADVPEDNLRVITAYHPRPEEWSKDLKRRKQK
jgi:hypothetical protein